MGQVVTAATVTQSAVATGTPSATQNNLREVGDEIRYLGKGDSLFCALIQGLIYDSEGNEYKKPGLISKKPATQVRYEMETQAPMPDNFTVSSGTEVESSGIVLASVNGVYETMTMYNPRNKTSFRVENINSTTVKGTSFGGTFSAQAGDVLLAMAPAQPEGYDAPPILTVAPSFHYNILQDMYLSTSITDVADAIKYYAHEKGSNSRKQDLMLNLRRHIFRVLDRTLLFGNMTASGSSKNTTTGTVTGYTGEFRTTKGIYQLAANEWDASGGLDWTSWKRDVPQYLSETVNDNETFLCLCGTKTFSRCFSNWVDDLVQIQVDAGMKSMLNSFGWKSNKFITDGPTVEVIKHEAFDKGELEKQIFIFNPKNFRYRYLPGMDFTNKPRIQTNAARSDQEGIYATCGMETLDAGQSALRILNAWA